MLKYLTSILILITLLSACSQSAVDINQTTEATNEAVVNQELPFGKVESRASSSEESQVSFSLDLDGETSEVEMPSQDKITAYDVLNLYAQKQGIGIKTKKYDFGLFIEGIGDKIGDSNKFWLFYVNDKLANSSADKTEVKPGDVIKFVYTNESPF